MLREWNMRWKLGVGTAQDSTKVLVSQTLSTHGPKEHDMILIGSFLQGFCSPKSLIAVDNPEPTPVAGADGSAEKQLPRVVLTDRCFVLAEEGSSVQGPRLVVITAQGLVVWVWHAASVTATFSIWRVAGIWLASLGTCARLITDNRIELLQHMQYHHNSST